MVYRPYNNNNELLLPSPPPFPVVADLIRYRGRDGAQEVSRLASYVPRIQLEVEARPITRNILRVNLTLQPDFTWVDRWHGSQQGFWVWVEDPDQGLIYHSEYWTLSKRAVCSLFG